jgi:hypothetical protein
MAIHTDFWWVLINHSTIEILCLAVIVMFGWDDSEWSPY